MTTLWDDFDLADGRDRSAMRRGTSAMARPRGAVLPRRSPRHRGLIQFLTAALVVGAVVAGLMVCFTLGQDRTDTWCQHQANRASIATCDGRP